MVDCECIVTERFEMSVIIVDVVDLWVEERSRLNGE
jgi:hypothetical protein